MNFFFTFNYCDFPFLRNRAPFHFERRAAAKGVPEFVRDHAARVGATRLRPQGSRPRPALAHARLVAKVTGDRRKRQVQAEQAFQRLGP